jgi:hypothetical protein
MYKLTNHTSIQRLADNASIPSDHANRDYADYLEWLAAGNTPEPVDAPTSDESMAALSGTVQTHLDATARSKGYDSIISLCSYATSTHPQFGPEGLAGVNWRDAVWAKCQSVLADVLAGTRPVPTAGELLAELPAMVWPWDAPLVF